MKKRLIPIAVFAALVVTACDKTASSKAKDVGEAREDAALNVDAALKDARKTEYIADEKVADAQQKYAESDANAREKLSKVEAEAMIKKAQADFDVAIADVEGRHSVAKEKCNALDDADKDACLSSGDATLAADTASATAIRDAALVEAEHYL